MHDITQLWALLEKDEQESNTPFAAFFFICLDVPLWTPVALNFTRFSPLQKSWPTAIVAHAWSTRTRVIRARVMRPGAGETHQSCLAAWARRSCEVVIRNASMTSRLPGRSLCLPSLALSLYASLTGQWQLDPQLSNRSYNTLRRRRY